MRIVHLMLFNFYIDDAFYQENILPRQNKADGHEVLIIASTHVFGKGNSMKFIEPGEYYTKEGIKVIRVPYKSIINKKISEKIRAFKNVYQNLVTFKPDVIFSHGIGGYVSKTIAKYIKRNPSTRLYIDCHSDYFNSASTFISKNILHRAFYRFYFWRYVKYAQKVYYVSPESVKFLKELYGFNNSEKLEYLPLGGYIVKEEERVKIKKTIRKELNIPECDIVFIHTGKMDAKKKSFDLIKAFSRINSKNIWLLIVGSFSDDVYSKVKSLIELDNRILFLGWKKGEEIQNYLCASDVYLQPGGRTVTVQNAVCCGCAIVVSKRLSYTYLFDDAAMYAETEDEIFTQLNRIIENPYLIRIHQKELVKIAKEKLDYKKLANKYH
jgi:hypothetical protein